MNANRTEQQQQKPVRPWKMLPFISYVGMTPFFVSVRAFLFKKKKNLINSEKTLIYSNCVDHPSEWILVYVYVDIQIEWSIIIRAQIVVDYRRSFWQ